MVESNENEFNESLSPLPRRLFVWFQCFTGLHTADLEDAESIHMKLSIHILVQALDR
jgi:hypothetical protein